MKVVTYNMKNREIEEDEVTNVHATLVESMLIIEL